MKKGTKIGLSLAALLLGAVVLTGCTNSFCTAKDKAHILYAFDHGVCEYYETYISTKQNQTSTQGRIPRKNEK